MSVPSPGQEFDLTYAPALSPRGPLAMRIVALGIIFGIGGLVTALSVYNEITGVVRGIPSPAGLGIIGFAAFFVGMGVIIYFGMGPGATRCVWEADGFTFHYRNGRVVRFRWKDPRLKLEIAEIHYEEKVEYDLLTRMPFHNDVTVDLYQAILTEADKRGLDIRSTVTGIPATRIITNRIRSRERARKSAGAELRSASTE